MKYCLRGLLTFVAVFTASTVLADGHQPMSNIRNLDPYFIKEGVDLGQYNRVFVDNLKVLDARVIAPPWYEGDNKSPKKWRLTEKDTRFLRDSYRVAMIEKLNEGGYEVVEAIDADDILILDVEIITLMPYARKGENVQTRGFGELTAQATLRDGLTSELLAIFEGTQDVGSEYQQNSRMNAENNLNELFELWGLRMRYLMDDARKP
ncbi:MAG: DUF3313 family protein [Gammaproteobacteria bacterium]